MGGSIDLQSVLRLAEEHTLPQHRLIQEPTDYTNTHVYVGVDPGGGLNGRGEGLGMSVLPRAHSY